MTEKARWTVIMIFAVAMAYVEAAVVMYLRVLVNQIDPYPPNPLAVPAWLIPTEIAREAATVAMLLAVGWLAGLGGISALFGRPCGLVRWPAPRRRPGGSVRGRSGCAGSVLRCGV